MTQLPHGWVTIRGTSLWRSLWSSPTRPTGYSYLLVAVAFQVVVQFGIGIARDQLGPVGGWIAAGGLLLAVLGIGLWSASRTRTPSIDFDASLVRVGRTTFRFDEITDAAFLTIPHRNGPSGYLRFGTGRLPAAVVCVRSTRENELSPDERELVAEVLRRAAVRVPQSRPDRYDPAGRFGWLDHPNSLSRDEAIEYVLHTPASAEPVREAQRPKSIWIDED